MEAVAPRIMAPMGGVVVAIAVLLISAFWAVIMLVMIRASNAQRARTKRTDFAGRYTVFGFVFGLLRDNDRRDHSGQPSDRSPRSEDADRSTR
jgi:O-antigen ligase